MRCIARQQPDNKLLAALRNDCFFGNDPCILTHAKYRVDTRKHAWPQLQLAVVNAAANANRAAIGVNQRVNCLNFCSEFAARQRVHVKRGGLTSFNLGLKALWQPEVDKHRVHVFNVDDVCTVPQIVAHIDQTDARNPVERCNDFQALCSGPGQRQFGLSNLQICRTFIKRALANEILCHQFLVAFLIGLGN